ncbi:MAG: flagellar basal-body rod protein FlgF [Myxococcota bacterium]
MSDGIYSALSGAVANQRSLEVVANNVANANTTGYRADRVSFTETVAQAQTESAAPEDLSYVALSQIRFDESTGSMEQTGNPLDVAIQGRAWLTVETPDGERYTRAGSLRTNAEGTLVTHEGLRVLDESSQPGQPVPIQIPPGGGEIRITENGEVHVGETQVGQLQLREFDRGQLEKQGLTLFTANGAGRPATDVAVLQGYLEGSNINAVAGLNELINTSRSFEAFQRVIQGFRDIDQRTARDIGGNR